MNLNITDLANLSASEQRTAGAAARLGPKANELIHAYHDAYDGKLILRVIAVTARHDLSGIDVTYYLNNGSIETTTTTFFPADAWTEDGWMSNKANRLSLLMNG